MAVFLQSRKNDQFREGSWVFVSRWKDALYPVALTEQFFFIEVHVAENSC